MPYLVAGIDVHKKMLAVVVADVSEPEWKFERRKFGTQAGELTLLTTWLAALGVAEAVMESTAQYWKPVWEQLEGQMPSGTGPSAVEPRTARTEIGLQGRGAVGAPVCSR